MTDKPDAPLPSSPVRSAKPAPRPRTTASLVWLVPLLALIVTVGLAWNAYSGRGILISVQFADATGINPGETALKYREVTVGKVESVRFTPDLSKVVVNIRVDKDVAQYIDQDAEFWIVRPQVSTQGIQRLDTVLTGAFIEGYWDDKIEEPKRNFIGLDRMPLTRVGAKGTWIVLSAPEAKGLSEGAPITYRGVQVGTMQNLRLGDDDTTVLADAFITAPHDKRLTTATVFWDTSGFSVSLGPKGVALNVSSVASLLQGGIEFATLTSGGKPVPQGYVFKLQPDQATAESSIFLDEEDLVRLTASFEGTAKGLEIGSDVKFQDLTVGRVTDLAVKVDPDTNGGAGAIHQVATLSLTPSRLGLPSDTPPEQVVDFLTKRVENGMRARLTSAGFFGTSLAVELADIPDSTPAALDTSTEPYPTIPTVPSDISDFTDTAQGVLAKVGNLPIEEALQSATDMMNSITAVAASEDTRALPGDIRSAITKIDGAAGELQQATADIRASGGLNKFGDLMTHADEAIQSIKTAADGVPEMVDKVNIAADSVYEFDFAGMSVEAKGILTDIRAMLGTEDAEKLPKNISATLEAATGLLNDLRDGNAAGSLNEALKSAKVAADKIAVSVDRLPQLSARVEQLAANMNTVISGYGPGSTFNNETINLMRSFRGAANSVNSLARMIERNPRAFILGK